MSGIIRWTLSLGLLLLMTAAPYAYYRYTFEHARRLRPVAEAKLYRSGCLTAEGFTEALTRLKIRTVLNLMEESPDPNVPVSYFNSDTVRESELCRKLGVKLVTMTVDLLPAQEALTTPPAAVAKFRTLMDDPANYPVLIHCKAGLHRTGVMVAVYRMEYEGWTRHEALRELKSHGFGESASTSSNEYIRQYVMQYTPRGQADKRPVPGTLTTRTPR